MVYRLSSKDSGRLATTNMMKVTAPPHVGLSEPDLGPRRVLAANATQDMESTPLGAKRSRPRGTVGFGREHAAGHVTGNAPAQLPVLCHAWDICQPSPCRRMW